MAKYLIHNMEFRTKKDIERHVRSIIEQHDVGSLLGDDESVFLLDLLQRHHRAAQKIGIGIASIRVDLNTEWKPTKMFTLIRRDGSETDFSYRACIYPRNKTQDFQEACRQAVIADVLQFKRDYYLRQADAFNRVQCVVSRKFIDWNQAHVDHDQPWPFREIVKAYRIERNIDIDAVDLIGDEDGESQYRFRDAAIVADFQEFHRQRARLRVIGREANLRAKRPPRNLEANT